VEFREAGELGRDSASELIHVEGPVRATMSGNHSKADRKKR